MVTLLLATGCSARSSTSQAEETPCRPVASLFSAAPATGPARHVELDYVRCSDANSGMSAVNTSPEGKVTSAKSPSEW